MNVTVVKQWFKERRDRKVKSLPARYIDLVDLYKRRLLYGKGTRQSITEISAEIGSRVNAPLQVAVMHEIYFVSRRGHQNMVARRKYQFELRLLGSERIRVPASCNAALPIPREKDHGVARVSENVRRFMEFMEAAEDENAMVIQAGVWALTDGYYGIQTPLRTRRVSSRYGVSGITGSDEPAVSNTQIDGASNFGPFGNSQQPVSGRFYA